MGIEKSNFSEPRPFELQMPHFDLGKDSPHLEGILSPIFDQNEVDKYIQLFQSPQSVAQYAGFHRVDTESIAYWKKLIQDAISDDTRFQGNSTVLDVGSGNGISVFPLLELFPSSIIIASDLSIEMLLRIRDQAREMGILSHRLYLLQMNAERLALGANQADLIVGSHFLHHLIDPKTIFHEIYRCLKPGGISVVWEPIENGSQILSMVFKMLLLKNERQWPWAKIKNEEMKIIKDFRFGLSFRIGSQKTPESISHLDDKWWFTRTHLQKMIESAGLRTLELKNIYASQGILTQMCDHELRRFGSSILNLPEWARELIKETEGEFSREFFDENPFCVSILLQKLE
jgi:ubiquinone/menaquinone biosynthesis C-methylase UbiE